MAHAGKVAHKDEGITVVKWPTDVNFKQGGGHFFRSARELIPYSPTFKMMTPLLNVVFLPDPVSNIILCF